MKFVVTTPAVRLVVESPGRPVLEVLQGETLTISPIDGQPVDSITQVSGPSSPTITGLGVAAISTTGSYLFTVTCGGTPCDLKVVCYAAGCVTAMPDYPRGNTSAPILSAAQKRLVIRSIVNDPAATWFDGSAAAMVNRSLYSYGA